MPSDDLNELKKEIRDFAEARNWGQFHTPKNLAMAIAGEAGELAAEFQWLTPEQSSRGALSHKDLEAIQLEIADVQIYLIRLADVLNIDMAKVVRKKLAINEERFSTNQTKEE
jgi:dCTP diphosphatase